MSQLRLHLSSGGLPSADYGLLFDANNTAGRAINAGTSWRVEVSDALDVQADGGQATLAVFRTQAIAAEQPIRLLERHRFGSQTFVPLRDVRIVMVLALGADAPKVETLIAVEVLPGQGITLAKGVWHHPLLALDDGDVLVLERRGSRPDCDVVTLPETYVLQASAERI